MPSAHILIVEDDLAVARSIQDHLHHLGYTVAAHAKSGEEAMRKAAETQPDLLLVDIRIQGKIDGIDAVKQIVADVDIPVIYLTAYADKQTLERAKVTEPYGYILKPYTIKELHSVIEIALYKHRAEQKVQQYRALFNTMHEAFALHEIIYDAQGIPRDYRFLEINPTFETLTGLKESDVIGKTVLEILPETESYWIEIYGEVALSGAQMRFEQYARTFDKYFEVNAFSPKPGQFATLFVDVSERKRTEHALRHERDRAQQYLDIAAVMLVAINPEGNITLLNNKGHRILGYADGELLGKNWFDTCLPANNRELVKHVFQQILRGEVAINEYHENTVLTKLSEERTILWHNTVLKDNAGNIVGTLSSGEDITEKKWSEVTLKRNYRDLAVLNRVISTAAITSDPVEVLHVLCTELGKAFQLPQVAATLIDLEQGIATVVAEYLEPERPSALGVEIPLNELASIYILENQHPLFIEDAQTSPLLAASRNEVQRRGIVSILLVPVVVEDQVISTIGLDSLEPRIYGTEDLALIQSAVSAAGQALETAKLHQELQERAEALEATVATRTQELQVALQHAKAADEAKSQFISNVSHELRTPLTSIRLFLDLLESGREENKERYMESLSREAERLQTLIESILTISRLDLGKTKAQLQPTDLNYLLNTLVIDRHRLFAERGLKLTMNLNPDLPLIPADAKLLEQVATNLLTNAMNYTPPGGRVELYTAINDLNGHIGVTFSVRDTGPGISDKDQARLFERFYRGEAGQKSPASGTGLGLSICQQIVKQHHGHITVNSVLGEGSTFTVWLPYNVKNEA